MDDLDRSETTPAVLSATPVARAPSRPVRAAEGQQSARSESPERPEGDRRRCGEVRTGLPSQTRVAVV